MAKVVTDDQHYTDIANAIREKTDSSETFTPDAMAAAIRGIKTEAEINYLTTTISVSQSGYTTGHTVFSFECNFEPRMFLISAGNDVSDGYSQVFAFMNGDTSVFIRNNVSSVGEVYIGSSVAPGKYYSMTYTGGVVTITLTNSTYIGPIRSNTAQGYIATIASIKCDVWGW